MFKVQYYQHTRNFYEQLQINKWELHITQSASLSEYLRSKKQMSNIFGYKSFVESLFPDWYHPHTEVYLKSMIRQFLMEHVDATEWSYYEKRVQDYYMSFRFLIEFGGLPLYEFPELSREQELLVLLYKGLSKDPIVTKYFTERAGLTKQKIAEKLNVKNTVDTVYFHHFDYIDGLRMMFFQLLKQVGYEIVFCIPYQPKWVDLYKSWQKIYEQLSGSSYEQWECMDSTPVVEGSKFAHYIDRNVEVQENERDDISFLTFEHPTKFKEYLQEYPITRHRHEVITIFEENLNIYTDHTAREHFYATTYGKFFLCLQNCKKTNELITIQYDDYVNMMVSGWVEAGNINGKQALTLLIDLRDYMEDATSFEEILERLHALLALQEFGNVFDELGKEQTERNRLKRYLANPLRAYSFFNTARYDITTRQLIECTKDLARKVNRLLLDVREKCNVQAYIMEIEKVYSTLKGSWDEEASQKFEALFRVDIPREWEFGKEELFQLLTYYLAAEHKNDQDKIKNFDQLVGEVLSSEHIHVTGLSLKTFPWKSPTLPALLTHTWLKNCIYKSFISNNQKIRLNALLVDFYSREVTRNTALYALYHLFAYTKGKITLSYIEELHENDGPSIYFTILEELYKKIEHDTSSIESEELHWGEDLVLPQEDLPLEKLQMIPDLLWLDSDFCHKKFFLNTFVEHHPVYEKDFHQQQVFATIGKLFAEQGDGEEEVKESLFPLFPQWTNAHKQNLIDTAVTKGLRTYKSFENIYYPKAMKRLQVLYSRYEVTKNWKAKYRYDHDTFKHEEHIQEFEKNVNGKTIKATAGNHCRMCPFLHVCEEGEYVIDANDF